MVNGVAAEQQFVGVVGRLESLLLGIRGQDQDGQGKPILAGLQTF